MGDPKYAKINTIEDKQKAPGTEAIQDKLQKEAANRLEGAQRTPKA